LRLEKELKALEIRLTQAVHRQTLLVVGPVGSIMGLVRLLDPVIK